MAAGDRIALIGPSGGGKSTLMRVLAGLYDPQRVQYAVEGEAAAGVRHLGSISTLIPQESESSKRRCATTSRRGGILGRTDRACGAFECARRGRRVTAAKVGHAAVRTGIDLSGGQRQRLALARGLLAGERSSILLLDEPTSALDQATETAVFERLREGLPDTCIIASIHRLSALIYFNRVIVMADGRIADSGTVAEILERQPAFREVVYSAAHGAVQQPVTTARTVH